MAFVAPGSVYSNTVPVGDLTTIRGAGYLMRLESDGLWWERMQLHDTSAWDLSWSPDGSKVAYLSADQTAIGWSDFADAAENGRFLAAPGTHLQSLNWSSDGSTLYFDEQTGGGFSRMMAVRAEVGWTPYQISPEGDDTHNYWNLDAAANGDVVVTQQTYGTTLESLYLYDPRHTGLTLLLDNASDGALSPDGRRLAWERMVAGYVQIFVSDLDGGGAIQVTAGAADHGGPKWSPDGKTITFDETLYEDALGQPSDGPYSWMASVPADGSGAAHPTVYLGFEGPFAYQPMNTKDTVATAAGTDRYATAVAISQTHWATAGIADARQAAQSVVLTRGDLFADALSAGPLAADKVGPLLLTPPGSLDARTRSEISRVLGSNHSATVYLIGSTAAISTATEAAVRAMGYNTVRLAGQDRYATSLAVANAISTDPNVVLAATGADFPDALSAGAAAGAYDVPGTGEKAVVVLTSGAKLSAVTGGYLDRWGSRHAGDASYALFGVGGSGYAATSKYGAAAVYGDNRYDTADDVDTVFFGAPMTVGTAPGNDWPDSLAGGALLGTLDGPLLLTNPYASLATSAQGRYLRQRSGSINTVVQFGGTTPTVIHQQFGPLISGPGGWVAASNPTKPVGIVRSTPLAQALRTPADAVEAAGEF